MTEAERREAKKPLKMALRLLGPGLVTGAADVDPSGIATYSQAGAQFGYGLLWTVFLTTPFMIAIQVVSARIGRVTGKGLAANVMELAPRWLVLALVFLLVAANTINIAADIAAMGESLSLVIGGLNHEHALIFAATSTLLQVFVPYRRYAPVLKFLTLTLFAYVATARTVKIPWSTALLAMIWPRPAIDANYFLMVVAVLGTTISPYLFFWQASQEVEDMNQGRINRPLRELTRGGFAELERIKIDTTVGMIFSNVIAFFIILTTALTLNRHGNTHIETSRQAAEALRPFAGKFATTLFAVGIVGVGFLAIPTLAGSAAYAFAETLGWRQGLDRKIKQARWFYVVILLSTAMGVGLDFAGINPVKALYWTAVINGLLAPFLLVAILIVAADKKLMQGQPSSRLGWIVVAITTIAMFAAGVAMFVV